MTLFQKSALAVALFLAALFAAAPAPAYDLIINRVGDLYGSPDPTTPGSQGSPNADVSNLELNIIGPVGILGGNGYGGSATGSGQALNNRATVNNGAVTNSFYGGKAQAGQARGNAVAITNSSRVDGEVYGGMSDTGGPVATPSNSAASTAKSVAMFTAVEAGARGRSRATRSSSAHWPRAWFTGASAPIAAGSTATWSG